MTGVPSPHLCPQAIGLYFYFAFCTPEAGNTRWAAGGGVRAVETEAGVDIRVISVNVERTAGRNRYE